MPEIVRAIENVLSVDEKVMMAACVGGRGGKEGAILQAISGLSRSSSSLYDAIGPAGEQFEIKKQQDLQWLDPSKYANSSETSYIMFVMHGGPKNGGLIDAIWVTRTEDFLRGLAHWDPQHWSPSALAAAAELKQRFPSYQIKAPIKVRAFRARFSDAFQTIYHRPLPHGALRDP